MSIFSIALTIFLFLRQKETTFALAAGIGIGLGFFSGYNFLAWIIIIVCATAAGYYVSNSILTDQSLFALVALNACIHFAIFLTEFFVSGLLSQNSPIKLSANPALILSGFGAIIAETIFLYFFFAIYKKARGKKATRLIHVS